MDLKFFSINDVFLVPLCFIFLFLIIRNRANNCRDEVVRKIYYKGFYFKMICVLVYTLVTEFYFGGGDTNLYYQGVKDLKTAVSDNVELAGVVIRSSTLTEDNPLAPYFLYDNYAFDITYNYMKSAGNFFMPRLGLVPAVLFFNSYLCISMCFSFFALGGALRLFKLFYFYYPKAARELAIAIVFLPSVGFWSAGLLKDTICFGCIGFILYGLFTIGVRKQKYIASGFWIALCSYLLYTIKTYIFLVLILAVIVWIFVKTNKMVKQKSLRHVFTFLTFCAGIAIGFFLLQYFTSQDTLKQYQFENIASSAEHQRSNYEAIDEKEGGESSYFEVSTSNPFLLIVNSMTVTFFRPFIWEVKSVAAVLSAIEALLFLLLTMYLFFKKGIKRPFAAIFSEPMILMCFVFAMVFAIGVGASTANFGALSRYKIPCLPFYLIMLLLTYRKIYLNYPNWFSKILGLVKI